MKVNIKWSLPEIDIDDWEFEFSCPFCRLETTVSLGLFRHEEYFICRGCHRTIKAIDKLGDVQKIRDEMKNLFKGFGDG